MAGPQAMRWFEYPLATIVHLRESESDMRLDTVHRIGLGG